MTRATGMVRLHAMYLRAAAACAVGLLAGCDRSAGDSAAPQPAMSATVPTTYPATQASIQLNSASQPASQPLVETPAATRAVLMIDGRQVEFPPARIILDKKGTRLSARMFSDDPKDALDADYAGNSFYFEMALEADPEQPGMWLWRYKSQGAEPAESPNGVYLRGLKTHLQPFDVLVEVDQSSPKRAVVRIIPPSQFRSYDKGATTGYYQLMPVFGELKAEVVTK